MVIEFPELADRILEEDASFPEDIVLKLSSRPLVVRLDALDYALEEARLAKSRYQLADRERWLVATTLIAAGIQGAEESGRDTVDIAIINEAWGRILGLCPPGTPPHLCAKMSIVDRKRVLLDRGDRLSELLRSVVKP